MSLKVSTAAGTV